MTPEDQLIEECFRENLILNGMDTMADKIFIPGSIAADWLSERLGDKFMSTTYSSRYLNKKIKVDSFEHISKCLTCAYGRGFLWTGDGWWTRSKPMVTDLKKLLISTHKQ